MKNTTWTYRGNNSWVRRGFEIVRIGETWKIRKHTPSDILEIASGFPTWQDAIDKADEILNPTG